MAEFTLLLGANRGDPPATFVRAATLIGERIGPILAVSRDHWTLPWGFEDDRLFLNRAILLESNLPPGRVMGLLLEIERELGRERPVDGGYASRPIDIDILFLEGRTVDEPGLLIPHPRVQDRAFALAPAADIVPALVHPRLNQDVLLLLDLVLRKP